MNAATGDRHVVERAIVLPLASARADAPEESGCRAQAVSADQEAPRARAVILLGVGSNVGKSQVAYGMCRMIQRRGHNVGFFKSLLVGRRRVPTHDSGYVGSQLAEYARVVDSSVSQANNPCFFDTGTSELFVLGQCFGIYPMASGDNVDFSGMSRPQLDVVRQIVLSQYATVKARSDFVVIEGGGSCTDDTDSDFTNAFVAANIDAHVVLVASGAHGGFAAALVGTYQLLSSSVRRRVRGFVCNQVDADLPQVSWNLRRVQERTGLPCLGCIPRIATAPSLPTREWADMVCGFLARGELAQVVSL